MISDDELNQWRDHKGRLPDVHELTDRIRGTYPEWNLFDVYEYGRQLYMASAARMEAKAAATRASTREIMARTSYLNAQRQPAPPRGEEKQAVNQYEAITGPRGRHANIGGLHYRPGEEPSMFWLLPMESRIRLRKRADRVRGRWTGHVKSCGFPCRVCSETFVPRNGRQKRCRACIDAGKRKDGAS